MDYFVWYMKSWRIKSKGFLCLKLYQYNVNDCVGITVKSYHNVQGARVSVAMVLAKFSRLFRPQQLED